MNSAYQTIRQAIIAKKPISFDYQGHKRLACPHVIGMKNGQQKALTYQYGGGSSSGLPPGGQWRCLFISEVHNVQVFEGEWHTGMSHTKPQTCVDHIDVQVFDQGPVNPYAKTA